MALRMIATPQMDLLGCQVLPKLARKMLSRKFYRAGEYLAAI